MSQIHDFVTDESRRHLLRFDDVLTVPDYVKESSVAQEDMAPLPNWLFALPNDRRYPVDTAGHTWLSYAYAKSAQVTDPILLQRLKQAAATFDLEAEFTKIDQAFTVQEIKVANVPEFAVAMDFGDGDPSADHPLVKQGGVHGFYPLNNRDEVIQSGRELQEQSYRLPENLYVQGCRKLVKAAQAFSTPLAQIPQDVVFLGEERLPDLEALTKRAERSAAVTKDNAYRELLKATLKSAQILSVASLQECADTWYQQDYQNFDAIKSAGLGAIYEDFQSGKLVSEITEEMRKWAALGSAIVPLTCFANLNEDRVRQNFPKVAADQIMKLKPLAGDHQALQAALEGVPEDLQTKLARFIVR